MKEMGQFPSYRPSLKDPVLLNFEFPYFGNQKTAQLLAEIADNVPPYYEHPFLMEALDLVNRIVLPNVLNGSKTPEEALNEAKVELDKMIKQW
jgi:ABC-type glycerol-3-phosphate transport system substrate-binding protein